MLPYLRKPGHQGHVAVSSFVSTSSYAAAAVPSGSSARAWSPFVDTLVNCPSSPPLSRHPRPVARCVRQEASRGFTFSGICILPASSLLLRSRQIPSLHNLERNKTVVLRAGALGWRETPLKWAEHST